MTTSTETIVLTARWRVLYTAGLMLGLLTAGFGSGGWLGLATGAMPSAFAIPSVVLLFLVLGRAAWVWLHPQVLTWPTIGGLRGLAKVSLVASAAGIVGVLALMGSQFYLRTLASDLRGGASLVIGLYLLPLIVLASLGLVAFEWARGWSARASVPAADRALLTTATIVGVLLEIGPAVSSALFPIDSLTRSQYSGILPWIIFALGLGALIVRGSRGDHFPASAVFSTTLSAYVAVVAVTTVVLSNVPHYYHQSGRLVNGVGFALVLAVVPASALAILGRLAEDRLVSWIMRALMAAPLVLTVAWLGISTGTRALRPAPARTRELVLSDEQLAGQAKHLQQRCAEAGTQVLRTQNDVTEVEVRFPDEPQNTLGVQLWIYPDTARPHDWFPPQKQVPRYERLVFVRNGQRWGYGPDATQVGGYGRVEAKDIYPRYRLTWKSLQTPAEEAGGILGNEMTIIDTQNDSVLARRVLFFKRTNERYGRFQEACGTLGPNPYSDAYVFKWVSTILVPKAT